MVGKGWSRTGVREGRGGAKATYFSLRVGEKSSSWRKDEQIPLSNSKSKLQLNAEQVWANYEYFIKAVMPTAEKCGELTPEGTPGYFTLGRLFANGYLKALLRGTEKPLY